MAVDWQRFKSAANSGSVKGEFYVDYCSHTFDFMGIRIGEQLHNGRPYSSSAGCCYYRGAVQDYSGTTCGVENKSHFDTVVSL